jgi:hypothetical protein
MRLTCSVQTELQVVSEGVERRKSFAASDKVADPDAIWQKVIHIGVGEGLLGSFSGFLMDIVCLLPEALTIDSIQTFVLDKLSSQIKVIRGCFPMVNGNNLNCMLTCIDWLRDKNGGGKRGLFPLLVKMNGQDMNSPCVPDLCHRLSWIGSGTGFMGIDVLVHFWSIFP